MQLHFIFILIYWVVFVLVVQSAADILWSVRPLCCWANQRGQCTVNWLTCGLTCWRVFVFVFFCMWGTVWGQCTVKWLTQWGKRGTSSGRRKWDKIGRRQQIGGQRKQRNVDRLKEGKEIELDGWEWLKVLNWLTPFGVGTIFVGIKRWRSWIWLWFSVLWSLNLGGGGFLEMTNESVCIVLSAGLEWEEGGWRRRRKKREGGGWWTFISEDNWTSGHKWVEAGIAAARLFSRLVHCSGS